MIGLLSVLGALLLGARAQQQEFRLVGSDVTLVPKYTGDLKEIKWELNDLILVEFVLKPQEDFPHNLPNDRTTINKTNGALTIRNLDIGDSGVYKAKVTLMNDSIQLSEIRLAVRAQQQEFRLVGSDVTLVPNNTGELKEIKWRSNNSTLVEIILKPQENFIYDLTNDRTTINKTNGALTIRNLTIGDSGDYEGKVILMDNSIQVTYIRLAVRDCPDQPIISVQSTKDWFVVSCKSFSTDVTYEWFNQATSVSQSQLFTYPKKSGTLTCVVDNEVCNKNSSINFYTPAHPEVKSEGDEVTLVPQYTGDPSEIIWKVNGDNLVEMMLKPRGVIIFHRLKDRATINHTDGSLTIRHLKIWDTGDYTAVVLVNNKYYYYTERRLTVHEHSGLSGVIIALIVCGVLSFIAIMIDFIIFLWYYCYKKYSGLSGRIIAGKVFGVLALIALIFLLCYCYKEHSGLSRGVIALLVFGVLALIALIILLCYYCYKENCRKKPETTTPQPQGKDIKGEEGTDQRKNEQGQEKVPFIEENDDDHTVENENAAPSAPAGDGNIDDEENLEHNANL